MRPKLVFGFWMEESLVVQPAVVPFDLQTDRADERAVVSGDKLKFREPPFQFKHRKSGDLPQRDERGQIIHSRASHLMGRRVHRPRA